jgi:hypothetical protein
VGLTVRPSPADRGGSEERRRRARQEAGDPFMVGTGGGEGVSLVLHGSRPRHGHNMGKGVGGGDVRQTEQLMAARHARADEFGRAAWHRPTTSRPRQPSRSTVTKAPRMDQVSEEGLGVWAQPGTRGDVRRRRALWNARAKTVQTGTL